MIIKRIMVITIDFQNFSIFPVEKHAIFPVYSLEIVVHCFCCSSVIDILKPELDHVKSW